MGQRIEQSQDLAIQRQHREELIAADKPWKKGGLTMNIWRKRLFAVMAKNARNAAAFFNLPPNRVVELGTQIEF